MSSDKRISGYPNTFSGLDIISHNKRKMQAKSQSQAQLKAMGPKVQVPQVMQTQQVQNRLVKERLYFESLLVTHLDNPALSPESRSQMKNCWKASTSRESFARPLDQKEMQVVAVIKKAEKDFLASKGYTDKVTGKRLFRERMKQEAADAHHVVRILAQLDNPALSNASRQDMQANLRMRIRSEYAFTDPITKEQSNSQALIRDAEDEYQASKGYTNTITGKRLFLARMKREAAAAPYDRFLRSHIANPALSEATRAEIFKRIMSREWKADQRPLNKEQSQTLALIRDAEKEHQASNGYIDTVTGKRLYHERVKREAAAAPFTSLLASHQNNPALSVATREKLFKVLHAREWNAHKRPLNDDESQILALIRNAEQQSESTKGYTNTAAGKSLFRERMKRESSAAAALSPDLVNKVLIKNLHNPALSNATKAKIHQVMTMRMVQRNSSKRPLTHEQTQTLAIIRNAENSLSTDREFSKVLAYEKAQKQQRDDNFEDIVAYHKESRNTLDNRFSNAVSYAKASKASADANTDRKFADILEYERSRQKPDLRSTAARARDWLRGRRVQPTPF